MAEFRVLVEYPALLELLERGHWWSVNRPKNPTLFDDEFEAVVRFLEHSPHALAVLNDIGRPGVRRKLMPRTRHHVYYVVRIDAVHVLAVANAQAPGLPELPEP